MKTVKQIAEAAGVKLRTVQFWTMNGALLCDPSTRHGGKGQHRQYTDAEAGAARIAGAMHGMGIGIGTIVEAMQQIRAAGTGLTGPALLVLLFRDGALTARVVATQADATQAMLRADSGSCAMFRISADDARAIGPAEALRHEVRR